MTILFQSRYKKITACMAVLLAWLWPMLGFAQTVSLSASQHHAVWHINLNGISSAQVHYFNLANPSRIVIDIDLSNADKFKSAITATAVKNTPIKQIRSAMTAPHKLRIVLDLKPGVSPAIFKIDAGGGLGKGVQATVGGNAGGDNGFGESVHATVPGSITADNGFGKTVHGAATSPHIPVRALGGLRESTGLSVPPRPREIIVVIDPGHGGKDPGATGLKKIHEKDIVLSIAQKLQDSINQQPGFKAVLTRNGDYYLTLRERLAIARKHKADIFIAVHADAYPDPLAHGVSVFALSQRGATSEAARWLAARENQSELMGGVDLSDKGDMLRSVLINLSQTATIQASLTVGQNMLENIHPFAHLHHQQMEQAAFVVLKSPDIPSLLVETGFLSNADEEGKLKSTHYQNDLAHAMMLGIKEYFIRRPPPGTWLAARENHIKTG